jgi:DNA primase
MLNAFQKSKLKIVTQKFEKVEDKPNIITTFEHLDDSQILKRSGRATLTLCPFHGENHPSFAMYDETNTYFCFSCGAKGDSYNLLMDILKIDFKSAVQYAKDHDLYDR